MNLPVFPTHDAALDTLEHALGTCYEITEDGTRILTGGDFTLNMLLDFYSGYDPAKEQSLGMHPDPLGFGELVEWTSYPDTVYSTNDVIQALITEIRRLRSEPA